MPESPADTIRRAAKWLRDDADRAERKDRSVMLNAPETRALADWLEFEATCLDEGGGAVEDPAGEHALNFALPYLGESGGGS